MTLDSLSLLLLIALQLGRIAVLPPAILTTLEALTCIRMLVAYNPRKLARALVADRGCALPGEAPPHIFGLPPQR